ncbi:hypothetical protein EVAR_41440_1 [Eumeta japonica]|uniref:Uncharacterized protein n=1 Tax=Eumeta variegata TaxID=151549 RepID=A0A4C1W7K3_EUMVA|nr:hypothetical protein EVAR_41440_1 [Eumeta japonica]
MSSDVTIVRSSHRMVTAGGPRSAGGRSRRGTSQLLLLRRGRDEGLSVTNGERAQKSHSRSGEKLPLPNYERKLELELKSTRGRELET